jgi:organic hydroperoxide reductase OsmC/OhrA
MESEKTHNYYASVKWKGNKGTGTSGYLAYEREHLIEVAHKKDISGSSDPAFQGDNTKHNPEELLVASVSACHMLWYLHLCSEEGVIVTDYADHANGVMMESKNGGGCFTVVRLNPIVTVAEASMIPMAEKLHQRANEFCFIANSVNFPVIHHAKTASKN